MKRYLRWAVALLTLMAMTLGAAAEGPDALTAEADGTALEAASLEALSEALAEGVDPQAEEIEMTLGDGEDDAQAATPPAEDAPAPEIEAGVVETPDGESVPDVAQDDETPEGEPDAAQDGETPEGASDAAQTGEKPEGEEDATQDGEKPEGEPEAAQVGETSETASEASGQAT
ncbi:MAG: hypothetical protein IKE76_02120, partial [Clostridia bacterium]|nr:hypothetical protein [Clostridia bacterium]